MKKRTLSFLLALVMCLSLLPMTALAAGTPDPAKFDAPIIADLAISEKETGGATLTFTLKNPQNIKEALAYYDENSSDGAFWGIDGEISIDGGEWKSSGITNNSQNLDEGTYETGLFNELHINSQVKFRLYYTGWDVNGYYSGWYGDEMGKYSNVLTLNEKVDINASDWAQPYVQQAAELGLIPEVLEGADLTKPINRAEFAAVAVKTYEALSGQTAQPGEDPFKDTDDPEVLKAFALGVASGIGADTFSPAMLLTREQASVMLTRVYQRATIPGWPENNPPLEFTMPAPFADDADISDWAKECVYFMAANGIISGVGNNRFAPKNVTSAQEASGYANATREQALIIAVALSNGFG